MRKCDLRGHERVDGSQEAGVGEQVGACESQHDSAATKEAENTDEREAHR